MMLIKLLPVLLIGALIGACQRSNLPESSANAAPAGAKAAAAATAPYKVPQGAPVEKIVKTDAQWKELLTGDQYNILRQKGTEPPFHNEYWNNHAKGTYVCAGCGLELFASDTKFESGTGWPSFWAPFAKSHVLIQADGDRNEVVCARCGGHLGHVFDDGPAPTHLRYCMDSAAMKFIAAKDAPAKDANQK